ncbi:MAG: histidine phosphatase family protein [Marinibacterium sp.]
MMRRLLFITHPDVVIDPDMPVPDWPLSDRGRARMQAFCQSGEADKVTDVWASGERKARDGAEILAARQGCDIQIHTDLGENDRSATGYLPGPEFETMADAFFAEPDVSVRGWERAEDAQARVVAAVRRIAAASEGAGDIALISHGGVGALFLCDRMGVAISRAKDQPGHGGGNFFSCTLPGLNVMHGWRDIAPDRARPGR